MIMYILINLKEIKPRHHLQLLKTFPKTTPDPSRIRTLYFVYVYKSNNF